ncbi:MAG: hypothetical protein WA621_07590 [Candidatus Acidiferrum sp.]
MIFAGTSGIDEFDFDVVANVFEMAIAPEFPGISGGGAAALLRGTIVSAAGGMGFDFVGRSPEDVDVPAIGFPAGDAGGEVLVGVGDAAIVFFAIGIIRGIRIGIAAAPEIFDLLFALFVSGEAKECVALFLGDDVRDLFGEPNGVGIAFLGELLGLLFAVLGAFRLS